MKLEKRHTKVISISQFLSLEVTNYSSIRLEHPVYPESGRPIDIGAIMYSSREKSYEITSRTKNDPTRVVLSSYRPERVTFLQNLPVLLLKVNKVTIHTYLRHYLKVFDWIDSNNFYDFMLSKELAFNAYVAYTKELEYKVKVNKPEENISQRTAKDNQWHFRSVIQASFPNDYKEIINTVPVLTGKANEAPIIEEESLKYYFKINLEVFKSFTAQCFDNNNFPTLLSLPSFESYYIGTTKHYSAIDSPLCSKIRVPGFNYKTGEILEEEITNESKRIISKLIYKPKNNPRCKTRFKMAIRAMHAFVEIFRILTCCNRSPLRHLEFTNKFITQRDYTDNEFIAIKFRAQNREVQYRLHKNGYKLFREYLKLRSWILNGRKCNWLFFSLSTEGAGKPLQLRKQHSDNHHNALKRSSLISPDTKLPRDVQLRRASTRFLLEQGYEISEVAMKNNHSVSVAEEIYSVPSDEEIKKEVTNFYNAIKTVTTISRKYKHQTVAGGCSSNKKEPTPIHIDNKYNANCNSHFGCLFCKYYACQPNDIDIRKLLSIKFIATEVKKQHINFEHASEAYDPIINRIDEILSQIIKTKPDKKDLIIKITNEVFEMCKLTDFWYKRLEYYEGMGMITL